MNKPLYLALLLLPCLLASSACTAKETAGEGDKPSKPFGYWSEAEFPDLDIRKAVFKGKRNKLGWGAYARKQNKRADEISDKLELFIRDWVAGKNDGTIPKGFLPFGLDNYKLGEWKVIHPEDISAKEQWWHRIAMPIDANALYSLFPDNNCTYSKTAFIAPYGSTLHMVGEFPHARFFDLQVGGPFDPLAPATVGFGAGEVPIVDVDIDPLPGHVNPFRKGASRSASKRGYHVTFTMTKGNAAQLNSSFAPPAYRQQPGEKRNHRFGGPFRDAGPAFEGMLHPGIVWMRYYLPDKSKGPFAGVPLPKCYFTLKTGEKFWIQPKSLALVSERQNTPLKTRSIPSSHPDASHDERWGWIKGFGIALTGFEMGTRRAILNDKPNKVKLGIGKGMIRGFDSKLFNRGAEKSAPGNYAVTATGCSYIHYLHRDMSIPSGYVAVLTGKLPTTPKTYLGDASLAPAQARYWSITHYGQVEAEIAGTLLGSLHDEEVVTRDGMYVIVFSSEDDRPKNASPANGVTWNDWGSVGTQTMLIRWMSIEGEHEDQRITPNEEHASWRDTAWSSKRYKPEMLGLNKPGFLGEYHPMVHFMKKSTFESLGVTVGEALRVKLVWEK